jgi:hypothetical protein
MVMVHCGIGELMDRGEEPRRRNASARDGVTHREAGAERDVQWVKAGAPR